MKLCWHEPLYRASPRELRIMLLHLLSTKTSSNNSSESDNSAFDKKWDQLMPRRPNAVVKKNNESISTVTKPDSLNTTGLTGEFLLIVILFCIL